MLSASGVALRPPLPRSVNPWVDGGSPGPESGRGLLGKAVSRELAGGVCAHKQA